MSPNHTLKAQIVENLPHIRQVVRRIARNEDLSDELVQECCAHIMTKEQLWDGNVSKFKAWASVICRNFAINYLVKHKKEQKRTLSLSEEPAVSEDPILEERIRWTLHEIQALPPRQQQLLEMKYLKGMRPIDIATELGISKQAVSNQVTSAIQSMHHKARRAELLSLILPWKWFPKNKPTKKSLILASSSTPILLKVFNPVMMWVVFGFSSVIGLGWVAISHQTAEDQKNIALLSQHEDHDGHQNIKPDPPSQSMALNQRLLPARASRSKAKAPIEIEGLVANAGPDLSVIASIDGKAKVSLDGSRSSSPFTIVNYTWLKNDQVIASGEKAPIELGVGVHDIILTVIDSQDPPQPAFDALRIGVLEPPSPPQNPKSSKEVQRDLPGPKVAKPQKVVTAKKPTLSFPPIASAGPDQVLIANTQGLAEVHLDASASFAIGNYRIASYQWRLKNSPNPLVEGSKPSTKITLPIGEHTLELLVVDNYPRPGQARDDVKITILDEAGSLVIADAGAENIMTHANASGLAQVKLDGSQSHDLNGKKPDFYKWSQIFPDQEMFLAEGETPSVSLGIGTHTIRLSVWNLNTPQLRDHDITTIQVLPEGDFPPVAEAGEGQSVIAGDDGLATIALDGSQSYDPNGHDLIAYHWHLLHGNSEEFLSDEIKPQVVLPIGIHTIQLQVEDDEGLFGASSTTVTVSSNDNLPPVALAGDDLEFFTGHNEVTVTLHSAGSYDPDGLITLYQWRLWDGHEWELLYSGHETSSQISLPNGTHNIELTVRDNGRFPLEHTDQITVKVTSHFSDDPIIHFSDDFNRDDSNDLGHDWIEQETQAEDTAIINKKILMREIGQGDFANSIEIPFPSDEMNPQTFVGSFNFTILDSKYGDFPTLNFKFAQSNYQYPSLTVSLNSYSIDARYYDYNNGHDFSIFLYHTIDHNMGDRYQFEVLSTGESYEVRIWNTNNNRPDIASLILQTGVCTTWKYLTLSSSDWYYSDTQVDIDNILVQSYAVDGD